MLRGSVIRLLALCVGLVVALSQPASAIYSAQFYGKSLGKGWKSGKVGQGQVRVTTEFGPIGQTHHLVFDSKRPGVDSVAEATLQFPLSNYYSVSLNFAARSLGNRPDAPPEGIFDKSRRQFDGVSVSNDGVRWISIKSLADVGPNVEWFNLPLDEAAARLGGYGKTFLIRFSWRGNGVAGTDGLAIDQVGLTGTWDNRVTLNAPPVITEGAPPVKVRLMRRLPTKNPTTIFLSQVPPGVLEMPATVTFPAKAGSVEFEVSAINDGVLDPLRKTVIHAAEWFGGGLGIAAVRVGDVTPLALTLELPESVAEGSAAAAGRLVFNRPPDTALTVTLAPSSGELVVPASVAMPFGEMAATFPVQAFDDWRIDGDAAVRVSANYPGGSASATVIATDDDSAELRITLPDAMAEGSSVSGTVRLGSGSAVPVTVQLDPGPHLTVEPATLVLTGPSYAAGFTVRATDDNAAGPVRRGTVRATADGYAPGERVVRLLDDEPSSFRVDVLTGVVAPGRPFTVRIQALDADGEPLSSVNGPLPLKAVFSDGRSLPPSPASVTLQNGVWQGEVTSPAAGGTPVGLTATHATGISSASALDFSRILPLKAADLAFDPVRGKIYAAMPTFQPQHSNTILAIDPVSGDITGSLALSNDPRQLAITDGGEYLYVALRGNGHLVQIDLASFSVVRTFPLGITGPGFNYAGDICTVPGSPEKVLATLLVDGSTGRNGVVAFDRGIRMPGRINVHNTGPHLEASDDPSLFFNYDSTSTAFAFHQIRLDENGVSIIEAFRGLFAGNISDISDGVRPDIVSDGPFVFHSNGRRIDGRLPLRLPDLPVEGPVRPDLAAGRVYFLDESTDELPREFDRLVVCEPHGAAELFRVSLPESHIDPGSFIRWGETGLAFVSDKGISLFNGRRSMPLPTDDNDLDVEVTASEKIRGTGESFSFDIEVTNSGPDAAVDSLLTLDLSGCEVLDVSSGSMPYQLDGPRMVFSPGTIGAGESRRIAVTVQGDTPAIAACEARVSSRAIELKPENNSAVAVVSVGYEPGSYSFNQLALPVSSLVHDPARGLIWMGVKSTAGPGLAGSVIGFDPSTGQVTDPIPLRANPANLAISKNGTYLYVGLQDHPVVQRILLETREADLRIPMSDGYDGATVYAGDIHVLDGDGTSFIATLFRPELQNDHWGVAVYDGEVRRPEVAQSGLINSQAIEPSSDPTLFFGYENDVTSFRFGHLRVTEDGVREVAVRSNLFSYEFYINIKAVGDLVYGTDGTVINGMTFEPIGGFGAGGPMLPDSGSRRAYFFGRSSAWQGYDLLEVYDMERFSPVYSISLPKAYEYPRSFTRWGDNGLAFASGGAVVIFSDPQVVPSDPATDLGVEVSATPDEVAVGQDITYGIKLSNQGANPAAGCVVSVSLSPGQTVKSVSGALHLQEGDWISLFPDDLAAGETVLLTLVTEPTVRGTALCSAMVTSTAVEMRIEDNSDMALLQVGYDTGADAINVVGLATTGLVEDPERGLVWASLVYSGPGAERMIVSLDPRNGRIVDRIPIPFAPGRLSISHNGLYLYAALLDRSAVQRIDLPNRKPDLLIPLDRDRYAGDIEVLEGDGRSFFVSLRNRTTSDGYGGLAVYDDAVKRPRSLTSGYVNWIEPSADPAVFFGVNTVTTFADFYRLRIEPDGVSLIDRTGGVIGNFGGEIRSDGDTVFGYRGEKIDGSIPALADVIPAQGAVLPALESNRVFYFESRYAGVRLEAQRIRAFDGQVGMQTFDLPLPPGLFEVDDFIRCDTDRLAFRTDDSVVFVRSSRLIPSAGPSDLSVTIQASPNPATVGQSFAYTLQVTNHGQVAAADTMIGVNLSAYQTIGPVSGAGVASVSGSRLRIDAGDLAPGTSKSFSIQCTPLSAGALGATAGVTSSAVDFDLSNNQATLSLAAGFVSLPDSANRLRVNANDIIDDPTRGRIWASVGAVDGIGAVVAINPLTGLITDRLNFPGNPTVLAISRNGRYLYAALTGSPEIQRFDLQGKTADLRIPLGVGEASQAFRAEDMVVLEGDGTSVLVSRNNPPLTWSHEGVAVYDGAAMRPLVTGSSVGATRIEASPDPTVFYGFNGRNSEAGVRTLKVDASGVIETRNVPGLAGEFKDFRADGGLLLSARGKLIDGNALAVLGTFNDPYWTNPSSPVDGLPWIDSVTKTAYYATGGSILSYSTATLLQKGSYSTSGAIYPGEPVQFIRWGSDGFAVLAESVGSGRSVGGDKILFVRWSAAPYPPRALPSAPAAASKVDPLAMDPVMDTDGDGLTDAFEYLFGTSPEQGNASPLTMTSEPANGATVKIRFPRRAGLAIRPYRYSVSADLHSWQAAVAVTERVTGTAEKGGVMIEWIEAEVPKPSVGRGFIRLDWTGRSP